MPILQKHVIELLQRRGRLRLLALCEPEERTRYVYFPVYGAATLAVGMVGGEGILGVRIAPLRTLVQRASSALRVGASVFIRELAESAALSNSLSRYAYVLMQQIAASAGCLRFHEIGPRLTQWLLMSQDRAHADTLSVPQEFIAYLLGVRRVGVTRAADELQRADYIEYHRGEMTVHDRTSLEGAACGCYASDRKTYVKVLELSGRCRERQRPVR